MLPTLPDVIPQPPRPVRGPIDIVLPDNDNRAGPTDETQPQDDQQ